ncbi:MAG TPA: hypothetical protein VF187_08480 [Gemmatimonadales bacterium]
MAYGAVRASWLDAGLTAAAFLVMVRPGLRLAVAGLAALHVAVVLAHLPGVYNHWYFAGLVSLSLLIASATGPAGFLPAGRWSLLLLYGLGGFHKLNGDFLTPGVSCASVLYEGLRARVGLLPAAAGLGWLLILLTLATELGLPLLLARRRWRTAGVLTGLAFHLVMALAGYPRFSATGLALLTLFLPPSVIAWNARSRVAFAAGLAAAVALFPVVRDRLFLFITVALIVALFIRTVTLTRRLDAIPEEPAASGLRGMGWAVIGPLLILASGLSPYLGLGTDRAFSMYSNLRTEGGRTNHLLIPARTQLFGLQRDLVPVLESDDPRLAELATRGMLVPFAELRATLSDAMTRSDSSVSVSYLRNGVRFDVPDAAGDTLLRLPVSPFARKFLRMRPVEAAGSRRCGV